MTENKALPRGTIKRFREYLNALCSGMENHRHGPYQQRTRGYGDYLYHQDREKFDADMAEAIEKGEFKP